MNHPFDLGNATIRDLPHVLVTRQAPKKDGQRCTYHKIFKADGLNGADYWIDRENSFLFDFESKKLRHVVKLAGLERDDDGPHTPIVRFLATFDAGITIEDWLNVRPRYADGTTQAHPFTHAYMFFSLLKACLVALKEIHRIGIVHCDIKADNICLPYSPYPFNSESDNPITIDFEHIRLIDFAFSITPERLLKHHLPILPKAPYQSNSLKSALQTDYSPSQQQNLAVQQLDWRVDLFSLGYMAEQLLGTMPKAAGGRSAYADAERIVKRLKAFDAEMPRINETLPHDGLIENLDKLIGTQEISEQYRSFCVVGNNDREVGLLPTPMTNAVAIGNPSLLEKGKIRAKAPNETTNLPVLADTIDLTPVYLPQAEGFNLTALTPIASPMEYYEANDIYPLAEMSLASHMEYCEVINNPNGLVIIPAELSILPISTHVLPSVKGSVFLSLLPLTLLLIGLSNQSTSLITYIIGIALIFFTNMIAVILWKVGINQEWWPIKTANLFTAVILFIGVLMVSFIPFT